MATSNGTTLPGKSIIVTGGASGIGLAAVKFFASTPNSQITILDISAAAAETVLLSLRSEFPKSNFLFKKCDISNWDEQAAVFKEVYKEVGHIDIVFANAGVSEIGTFLGKEDGEPEKPNLKTLEIDVIGTLYSIKLAIHYMRKNTGEQKGSILVTASNAGLYGFSIAPMYGTSKHAIVGAVRSLAKPLVAEGVQINAICPNCIETGLAGGAVFSSMILTPMSVAIDAIREFVTKPQLTGQTAEISGDVFTLRKEPEFVDDITRKNFDTFWALGYA